MGHCVCGPGRTLTWDGSEDSGQALGVLSWWQQYASSTAPTSLCALDQGSGGAWAALSIVGGTCPHSSLSTPFFCGVREGAKRSEWMQFCKM